MSTAIYNRFAEQDRIIEHSNIIIKTGRVADNNCRPPYWRMQRFKAETICLIVGPIRQGTTSVNRL